MPTTIPQLISIKDVMAEIAKWVVFQSPYNSAQGVDHINKVLYNASKESWELVGPIDIYTIFDSPHELNQWLHSVLDYDLTIKMLNTPKRERPLNDHSNNPDYDFIDIDALIQNISNSLFPVALRPTKSRDTL